MPRSRLLLSTQRLPLLFVPLQLPTNFAQWPPVVYAQRDSSVESVMRRSVEAARAKFGPKPLQLILVLLPTKV